LTYFEKHFETVDVPDVQIFDTEKHETIGKLEVEAYSGRMIPTAEPGSWEHFGVRV
jgi:hypothetical protein